MAVLNFKTLKESFDRDGYVFIPGFLSPEEVQILNENVKRFISEGIPSMSAGHYFYEGQNDA